MLPILCILHEIRNCFWRDILAAHRISRTGLRASHAFHLHPHPLEPASIPAHTGLLATQAPRTRRACCACWTRWKDARCTEFRCKCPMLVRLPLALPQDCPARGRLEAPHRSVSQSGAALPGSVVLIIIIISAFNAVELSMLLSFLEFRWYCPPMSSKRPRECPARRRR
jgi:hypothetical protein